MFTGLIEAVGTVVEARRERGSLRLTIASDLPVAEMREGESVAVAGVCLTVARLGRGRFEADAIPETLARTTLGRVGAGDRVNLERALRLGDRLGGHLVQGHVDACTRVTAVSRGADWRMTVAWAPGLRPYIAPKGSVTLDGVSLTVAGTGPAGFQVALIPETLERTTLGAVRRGDSLNVEVDLVARYLEALLAASGSRGRGRKGGP